MSVLKEMPPVAIPEEKLKEWGALWRGTVGSLQPTGKGKNAPLAPTVKEPFGFDKKQGMDFAGFMDEAFAKAIAAMLGDIPVVPPTNSKVLLPPRPNCVELGATRIVGGIRTQNYDVAYRPDGPRIVFDSKGLNDAGSIPKNWQNMVNDLATEASTVHTRFPFCVVAFMVVMPRPALRWPQEQALIRTLERLGSRRDELDQAHLAEAVSFIIWDPETGTIDPNSPGPESPLRVESLHKRVYKAYLDRYANLPPHTLAQVTEEGKPIPNASEGEDVPDGEGEA